MSLWTSTVITVLLLQTAPFSAPPANDDNKSVAIDEVAKAGGNPAPPAVPKKDWDLTQAYFDVFKILNNQNPCSGFYGGPRAATVLNNFVTVVKPQSLVREVTFQMAGRPRLLHDAATGASYRLFDNATVNRNGSFYQRRADPMSRFPSDVGRFAPGTRPARALILLHELGHLIQGEDGAWLIPDDGHNGPQSKANTLRVQQVCRTELERLQ
jgi:hypothetical protein